MPPGDPRRGEVWLVEMPGAVGSELRMTRPAVIVSTDAVNTRLRTVQIVPLTHGGHLLPRNQAPLPGQSRPGWPSRALANQVATVDKARLQRYLDRLPAAELAAIEDALRWQLEL
jgi:mRNA interferase MazF